jgi:hypothetical protein
LGGGGELWLWKEPSFRHYGLVWKNHCCLKSVLEGRSVLGPDGVKKVPGRGGSRSCPNLILASSFHCFVVATTSTSH